MPGIPDNKFVTVYRKVLTIKYLWKTLRSRGVTNFLREDVRNFCFDIPKYYPKHSTLAIWCLDIKEVYSDFFRILYFVCFFRLWVLCLSAAFQIFFTSAPFVSLESWQRHLVPFPNVRTISRPSEWVRCKYCDLHKNSRKSRLEQYKKHELKFEILIVIRAISRVQQVCQNKVYTAGQSYVIVSVDSYQMLKYSGIFFPEFLPLLKCKCYRV